MQSVVLFLLDRKPQPQHWLVLPKRNKFVRVILLPRDFTPVVLFPVMLIFDELKNTCIETLKVFKLPIRLQAKTVWLTTCL